MPWGRLALHSRKRARGFLLFCPYIFAPLVSTLKFVDSQHNMRQTPRGCDNLVDSLKRKTKRRLLEKCSSCCIFDTLTVLVWMCAYLLLWVLELLRVVQAFKLHPCLSQGAMRHNGRPGSHAPWMRVDPWGMFSNSFKEYSLCGTGAESHMDTETNYPLSNFSPAKAESLTAP